MKKLKGSLAAKTIAVILFCALCVCFLTCSAALGMLYTAGYYSSGYDAAREDLAETLCAYEGQNHAWFYPGDGGESAALGLLGDNYRYEVYDANGVLRLSNYDGEATLATATVKYGFWYSYSEAAYGTLWGEESAEDTLSQMPVGPIATPMPVEQLPVPTTEPLPQPSEELEESGEETFSKQNSSLEPTPTPRLASPGDIDYELRGRVVNGTLVCYLLRDMTQRDAAWFQLRCFDFAAANCGALIAGAVTGLLLALILFVFLLSAAGHRRDTDEIRASFVEMIPFDLFTVLIAAAGAGILYLFVQILDHLTRDVPFRLGVAALLFVAGTLLFLLWCMSLAVRVKQGSLIKSTILYKLFHLLGRAVKAVWGWLKMIFRSIPLVWRGLLIYGAAAFIGLILAVGNRRDAVGLWLSGNVLLFPFILWALAASARLRSGAKEIANGNTAYIVPTKYLLGECREHAEDLNRIQSGISRAVDERMRSERMKTELITNVSHDIKTPLTAIVSYVDLLSKEEIENEKAREYIEVLQRQSARLKKLTDDLVEASKASSGALGVTIEDCDLGVMLDQTAGEYGEKLAEKNLELVLRRPEREVTVRADARHTQRIFDNLMSNILKYALPGTRVYLELTGDESGAAVIFRNTSRTEIVQSAEELTERFVRGDASRSSEGSGLGLSIARSLAELQGGSLAVTVDGDLFKVTLGFAGK